ncbi:ABC transporter substrate-binding protein [Streptomyces sp. NPDC004539]|uniref:ABC transporter substrate-binding protein n=1 Tax=Streptomyces sp. NPDC004539 TaxID=3154280 RepID=UPI0033AF7DE3
MRRTIRPARRAVTMITAAAALAALSGCTDAGSSAGGGGGGKDKSTLTLGMSQDIQGWDPTNQPSYQGWGASAVYDTLLRCDRQGKPQPGAVKSWQLNPDNTGGTFTLHPGMKFSDGTPVNAESVKAMVDFIQAKGATGARFAGWKASAQGDLSFRITTKPNPLFVARLCELRVASPKYLASGKLNKAPVGSGPYTLDASATTAGSVYTFVKNDAYWDSKTFPYKKLVLKVLTNETAAINALKTGQIDGSLITQATYSQAEAAKLKIQSQKSQVTRLLLTDHLGKKVPALGSVDVRRAMNMVFDKAAIAKNIYRGLADPAAQIFRPGSAAYLDGLKDPYPFDVEAAKALMKKAGYPNGFELEIPFMQGQNLEPLMPVVIQQLGLLNIKVKQVNLTGPNAISELLSGKYPVPFWQLGNYGDSLQDISDYLLPDGIWNVMHQKDATVAEGWDKILTSDAAQSAEEQQALNRYIVDQAWFVPMVQASMHYAYNPEVDVRQSSDPSGLHPMLWDFQ